MIEQAEIQAEELRRKLEAGDPVELIDIRMPMDFAAWNIPGSRHVDAFQDIQALRPGPLAEFSWDSGSPVVAVCYVGQTSNLAAQYLRSRGIPARSLAGGMMSWSLAWNIAEVPIRDGDAQIIQIRRTGKGCLSYMVASGAEAAVLDASVDPQVYLDLAKNKGWRIVALIDTHIHADHLSRSRALAERTGAPVYLPRQARTRFEYKPVDDGDELIVGDLRLLARWTPGHTEESTCFLLDGRAVFTGDTLFLDGVGRPDLGASSEGARERAHRLFRSLRAMADLDNNLTVLPSHTGRPIPFDRTPLSASLAQVREQVELLNLDEEDFVNRVTRRTSPPPPNHALIVRFNESQDLPEGDPAPLEAGANRCAA